jgi:hypothetical protein
MLTRTIRNGTTIDIDPARAVRAARGSATGPREIVRGLDSLPERVSGARQRRQILRDAGETCARRSTPCRRRAGASRPSGSSWQASPSAPSWWGSAPGGHGAPPDARAGRPWAQGRSTTRRDDPARPGRPGAVERAASEGMGTAPAQASRPARRPVPAGARRRVAASRDGAYEEVDPFAEPPGPLSPWTRSPPAFDGHRPPPRP